MVKEQKNGFWASERLAKERAYEKRSFTKQIKVDVLKTFTRQLASMLDSGLPLLSALDALCDQAEEPVFRIILKKVRADVAAGTIFSDALRKYPNAFPRLFVSMVEAGEASGALGTLIGKASVYFEDSSNLTKKVKSAMAYPIAVVLLAIVLVNIMMVFVIPVFAELFADFNVPLPAPTRFVIAVSDFMQSYILFLLLGAFGLWVTLKTYIRTDRGRVTRDRVLHRIPLLGKLRQKIALSRFARTYAVLLHSGVPILRCITICSSASDNTYVESACSNMGRIVSQGGQLSEVVDREDYFPPIVYHMSKAGEKTGNIEAMMDKVADYYDTEIASTVAAFSSLLEPILIVILGVFVGGIVIAMFMPIFELAGVVGGPSGGF